MSKRTDLKIREDNLCVAKANKTAYERRNNEFPLREGETYFVFVRNYCVTQDRMFHCLDLAVINQKGQENDAAFIYENKGADLTCFQSLYEHVTGAKDKKYENLIGYVFAFRLTRKRGEVSANIVETWGNILDPSNPRCVYN